MLLNVKVKVKVKEVVPHKELSNTVCHLALEANTTNNEHTNTNTTHTTATGHDSDLFLGDDNGYERNGGRNLLSHLFSAYHTNTNTNTNTSHATAAEEQDQGQQQEKKEKVLVASRTQQGSAWWKLVWLEKNPDNKCCWYFHLARDPYEAQPALCHSSPTLL